MDSEQFTEYGFGQGVIRLRASDMRVLSSMRYDPSGSLMLSVLSSMKQAAEISLRNTKLSLDEIRVAQGKIEAVTDMANILTDLTDDWLQTSNERKEAE